MVSTEAYRSLFRTLAAGWIKLRTTHPMDDQVIGPFEFAQMPRAGYYPYNFSLSARSILSLLYSLRPTITEPRLVTCGEADRSGKSPNQVETPVFTDSGPVLHCAAR